MRKQLLALSAQDKALAESPLSDCGPQLLLSILACIKPRVLPRPPAPTAQARPKNSPAAKSRNWVDTVDKLTGWRQRTLISSRTPKYAAIAERISPATTARWTRARCDRGT